MRAGIFTCLVHCYLPASRTILVHVCACMHVYPVTSVVPDFATLWTVAHQAPLSMGFSRQEYWSGLPFPLPGDLPDPEIKSGSPALEADSLPSEVHCSVWTRSYSTIQAAALIEEASGSRVDHVLETIAVATEN